MFLNGFFSQPSPLKLNQNRINSTHRTNKTNTQNNKINTHYNIRVNNTVNNTTNNTVSKSDTYNTTDKIMNNKIF